VTEMLEAGLDGDGLLVDEENKHGAHTARVARLAMLMGTEIGLSQAHLQDLGVAALFHDVGYTAREGAIPDVHPGYPPPFERHAAAGARLLLKQRGFHEARIHRIRGILEHHDPCHGSSLFGRILRIADDFDNLSTSPQCKASPAVALGSMAGSVGSAYDPLLFQALVNRLGPYPPGTLLQLGDGRVAYSASLVRSPETFAQPICVIVRTASGETPQERIEVDIAAGEARIGRLLLD
jgi:HD superfamily phosphohydrolase YqeK